MVRKSLILLFAILLTQGIASSQSIYQIDTVDSGINKSIRFKIPAGVDEVEGILLMGNPWQGNVLYFVNDTVATEFARSINFAMMGTSLWGRFKELEEFDIFEYCIDSLGIMSGHPEISDAPVIIFGCSNGGQMAHSYNSLRPEKCIAFLVDKGGYYINPIPDTLALKTPGILVAGELDSQYRIDAINDLFYNNRPRGALWSHILCQDIGHVLIRETHLLFFLMAEAAYKLRYPLDQKPINGPISLRDLNKEDGWLSDSTTWSDGIISVFNYDDYTHNRDSASWHINKDLASVFAAHSSYNRINNSAITQGSVADSGDIVTFHFNPNTEWDSIYIYNKSEKVGSFLDGGNSAIDFNYEVNKVGFSSFFAKVFLSSGDSTVSKVSTVFVKGDILPNNIDKETKPIDHTKPFTIFPNPSLGLLNINFTDTEQRSIQVLDLTGRIISSNVNSGLQTQIKIFEKGLFLVKISFDESVFMEVVIVQ